MKAIVCTLGLLLGLGHSVAQEKMQTLFGGDQPVTIGGYGSPSVRFTEFDGKPALLIGAYGGVLINQRLLLGGGGYGMATQYTVPSHWSDGFRRHWEMGYGGFVGEYILRPNALIHLYGGALVGGGGITKAYWEEDFDWDDDAQEGSYDGSAFFVVEPHVGLEMNVVKFMRIAINGSYRHVSGSSTAGIRDANLRAFSLGFSLKFGKF